jgi:hypothetical protein
MHAVGLACTSSQIVNLMRPSGNGNGSGNGSTTCYLPAPVSCDLVPTFSTPVLHPKYRCCCADGSFSKHSKSLHNFNKLL